MYGCAFICEPVHNLVRCVKLTRDGATFKADKVPSDEHEFIASSDPWCRPVHVATGPDGALWIADMYRLVIEHPEWIPEAWQARLDLRAGADKGRIWRVRRSNQNVEPLPNLAALSTAELVKRLGSSNGTVRDLARESLASRNDKSGIASLKKLATSEQARSVREALAVLHAMKTLDAATLSATLEKGSPDAAPFAIRLSEPFLDQDPELAKLVAKQADAAPFQVALSLGECDNERAAEVLAEAGSEVSG